MSEPKEIPWVIEEHTKVKHQLLEEYVTVWMAIMFSQQVRLSRKQKLVYVDGFAGPGVYWADETKSDKIPGSPIIIANKANEFIEKDNTREVFILGIDSDDRCTKSLQDLLTQINRFKQDWSAAQGTFEEAINNIFDYLEQSAQNIAPAFFFIDPFGYSGFCMDTLSRILKHPRTELFINLNVYDIIRFLETEHATQCLLNLFGTDQYKSAANFQGDNKVSFLMDLYCRQLKILGNGLFVQPFRVNTPSQGTRPRYFLIHVSQNIKALKEMKNAMRKSSTQPFRFEAIGLDPNRQMDFFELSGEAVLKNKIYEYLLSSKQKVSFSSIEDWAYQTTNGIRKDIQSAIMTLENENKVRIVRQPRQRINTVVDGAMIEKL